MLEFTQSQVVKMKAVRQSFADYAAVLSSLSGTSREEVLIYQLHILVDLQARSRGGDT